MISGAEFVNLQESLVIIFTPILLWILAIMVALGFMSGVLWIFFGLFRWLTRGG